MEVKKMFVYKFDVLETLKESGYNPARLRKDKLLGENAIQSLRRGEMVGMIALEKICQILDMQPGNIIKYVNDREDKNIKNNANSIEETLKIMYNYNCQEGNQKTITKREVN